MQLTNTNKVFALTAPAMVGLLLLGYFYCCPALAQIPSAWNVIVARYLFLACFFGGAVTSILGLVFIKSKWRCWTKSSRRWRWSSTWVGWDASFFIAINLHRLTGHP